MFHVKHSGVSLRSNVSRETLVEFGTPHKIVSHDLADFVVGIKYLVAGIV